MSVTTTQRHAVTAGTSPVTSNAAEPTTEAKRVTHRRAAPARISRNASDDEILGIGATQDGAPFAASKSRGDSSVAGSQSEADTEKSDDSSEATQSGNGAPLAPETQAALDSIPELRQAWDEAQSYRESFATPEEARAATVLLNDLDRMDALFFSRSAEDHAELARAVAKLDPAAFASLAKVMNNMATAGATVHQPLGPAAAAQQDRATAQAPAPPAGPSTATPAQVEFLHAANAATVQGVLDAIETQVERLLPEGASKSARNRVVGEIYRELDSALGSNHQLGQQVRDAFRSGNLDAAHQRAIVALVTGRARQALPGIAKRVLNEWTSTVVAANQDRLARQRAAAHRVDIAGSGRGGDGGRRSFGPRDIDYGRMSDSDILNL